MRWPWQRRETREASGGYTEIISRLVEAQAAGTTQQASATAAVEAVAGALSRAFTSAVVDGPPDVVEAVSPRVLGQIGRDLIRVGESLHVIRMSGGRLRLFPASTWYWEGGADPADWLCTATVYGPSGSSTWRVPASSVVFVAWGSPTARPYHGLSPSSWAADTARLNANAERSLADEAGGPTAQLLAVPADGGDGADGDPLAALKSDISQARGKALLVETTAAGWGDGKTAAPQHDWRQQRLGPAPTEAMVKLADAAFARVLAAAGCSPSLFNDADGTSKREALRQWHLGTVQPLARVLETELTDKLGLPVRLRFDLYNVDLAGRAQAFQKLVAGGVAVSEALATSGLLAAEA
ncbi:MAG: phage portal protein [Alphaproteobacteria bacterium]|nr:phage portal protein [Alphaproteobacteria bacterium]